MGASASDSDVYDVVVTNVAGTGTSGSAVLSVRSNACTGDTNADGTVNFGDLVSTLFLFGTCPE